MVHPDINKLQNFKEEGTRNCSTSNRHKSANKVAGSNCMHMAVGDHSCYASASVMEDETAESITKLLIDYGSGYKSKMFAEACQTLNVKHIFTKPYIP